jgi:nucleotide-binding universal stress UspA family protein
MAKRILVPLDRTVASEAVLPLVGDLARNENAFVRLLHVAPQPETLFDEAGRVIVYADQEMSSLESEGLDYLNTVAAMLGDMPDVLPPSSPAREKGTGKRRGMVEIAVRFGDPVREILRDSDDYGADLIVMSTAGRRAITRVVGSVAEAVFHHAEVPVLLQRVPRAA